MFAVTGITGQVGGAVARTLLAEGCGVRAVVRDANKAGSWPLGKSKTISYDLGSEESCSCVEWCAWPTVVRSDFDSLEILTEKDLAPRMEKTSVHRRFPILRRMSIRRRRSSSHRALALGEIHGPLGRRGRRRNQNPA
jgi:hypothetical protein